MRIAISNQYWATAGGGESYALAVARALSELGDVELLGPEQVDWHLLAERLQTNLLPYQRRVVDFADPATLRRATADYDLFVDTTWASDLAPLGARNLLVVYFPARPTDELDPARRLAFRAAMRTGLVRRANGPQFVSGFHPPERGDRPFRWTDGDAVVVRRMVGRRVRPMQLVFGNDGPRPTEVAVEVNGSAVVSGTVGGGSARDPGGETVLRFDVTPRCPDDLATIRIRSDTFSPAEALGIDHDHRQLGVQLLRVEASGEWPSALVRRAGLEARAEGATRYLGYDRVISISEFTRTWLDRWWGVDSVVIEPAVTPRHSGRKEPIILAVGRFFPPARGHSKGQLELVRAFRRLADHGGVGSWQLHLVGGCQAEDRSYLDQVRAESEGLPIRFHVDASGRAVGDLFARASIFWNATGLSQPADAPENHEHFGIAVVEAMSAGGVPVVYGVGGPAATVRPGVDGLHFSSSDDLVAATRRLMEDDTLRRSLAASAVVRSGGFSHEELRRRLHRLVAELG